MAKKTNEVKHVETKPVEVKSNSNDKIVELLEQIREILEQLVEKNQKENTWRL